MTEADTSNWTTQQLRLALNHNTRRGEMLRVKQPNLEDALRRTENYVAKLKHRLHEVRAERETLKSENEWLRAEMDRLTANRNRLEETP